MSEVLGCVSDAGYITASEAQATSIITQGTINAAIETAVGLYQRYASKTISNIQTALADQQVTLAEEVQAHAIEFWPAEASLVNDVFGENYVVAAYEPLTRSFDGLAFDALTGAHQGWVDTLRSWCQTAPPLPPPPEEE